MLIRGSVSRCQEARILGQRDHANHLADVEPELVVAGRNGEVAIRCAECLVWSITGMCRAQPAGATTISEVVARLQCRDAERTAIHGHIDMGATASVADVHQ